MRGGKLEICFITSVIAVIVAIVMASYGFPAIVRRQIQKNIQLDNSSESFEKWRKLPFPLQFKVYLFNVTNPEGVAEGEKPRLNQVGPFCYDQYREKIILGYGENDTIRYMLKKSFVFNKDMSAPLTEDDSITVINLSYMALMLKVYEMFPGMVPLVNEAMGLFFPSLDDPFLRVRVGDLMFDGVFLNCTGENTALKLVCSRLKQQSPATMKISADQDGFYFSMFSHLNETETGPFEMNRGTEDIAQLGHITSYQGQTEMKVWRDSYCGLINGSDSSVFPPIDPANVPQRLYTFEPEVCRSMYAQLVGQTTVFNMTAYRYEVDRLTLACKSAVPSNKCFCQKNWSSKHDGCLLMGIQDLSPCQKVPVIASLPHFYLASEELLEYFDSGVKPDREQHTTYVIIEPTTGVVLKGIRRIQFNVELRQMAGAKQLENVKTGLFPMLWIEEGAEIPEDIIMVLRKSKISIAYVEGVRWTLLVVGLACCLWAGAVLARNRRLWTRRSHSISFVMGPKTNAFTETKSN